MTIPIDAVPAPSMQVSRSTQTLVRPARARPSAFEAVLDLASRRAPDPGSALRAPRFRAPETTGEAFEATVLVPFIAAMLPSEDSEIWGGTGGALWRAVFADALAADVARAGGIGIAPLVNRMIADRSGARPQPSHREGYPA